MKIRIHTLLTCLFFATLAGNSPLKAAKLDFSLVDSYGRKVSSQDYIGVPIFLEFGACW